MDEAAVENRVEDDEAAAAAVVVESFVLRVLLIN